MLLRELSRLFWLIVPNSIENIDGRKITTTRKPRSFKITCRSFQATENIARRGSV